MHTRLIGWLIAGLWLGAMTSASAEDLAVTTYYPSPRGIYDELQTQGNTYLAIPGGGTERVGIRTKTPGSLLSVKGSLAVGSGYADAPTAAPVNGLIVQGSVGIGTPAPQHTLDVAAADDGTGTAGIGIRPAAAGLSPGVLFFDDAGSAYGAIGAAAVANHYVVGSQPQDLAIQSLAGGITVGACGGGGPLCPASLRVDAAGRVGIGTVVPGNLLAVAGQTSIGSGYAAQAAPTDGLIVEGRVGIGTPSPNARLHIRATGLLGPALLRIDDQPIIDPTPFIIDRNGNVGIGTANPSAGAKLQVAGGSIALDRDEGVGDASQAYGIVPRLTGDRLGLFTATFERLSVTSAGNVGIGTTIPGQRLDVNGNVRIAGNLAVSGPIDSSVAGPLDTDVDCPANKVMVGIHYDTASGTLNVRCR